MQKLPDRSKAQRTPNIKKTNFRKIAPFFPHKVINIIACGVEEKGMISLKEYAVYNPLLGHSI